jgi:polynucleotide 5'-hydroxyl-kinase GRC3/NOL9
MNYSVRVRMVKGPAEVVVNGSCYVLGTDVSNQTMRVRLGRAIPFELRDNCKLQVRFGYGARLWWARPDQAGTSMWRNLAREFSYMMTCYKKFTVLILGGTNTGKSTLTTYLANTAIYSGHNPCVIDGDVGQGDLAPPTAIGAAIFSKPVVDLRDFCETRMFEFVGSMTPAGFEDTIARKLRDLLGRTSPLANIIIVNTDGYVSDGGGVNYKQTIAKKLQPDIIIILGESRALLDTMVPGPWKILRIRSSVDVYKSDKDRLNHRLDQFLDHVGNRLSTVELSRVKIESAIRLFKHPDQALFQPTLKQLGIESMKNIFVGLGSKGLIVGFGIIISVAKDRSVLRLQSDIDSFDTMYLSSIKLSHDSIAKIKPI